MHHNQMNMYKESVSEGDKCYVGKQSREGALAMALVYKGAIWRETERR